MDNNIEQQSPTSSVQSYNSSTYVSKNIHTWKQPYHSTHELLKEMHRFRVHAEKQQERSYTHLQQTIEHISQLLTQVSQSCKSFILIEQILQEIEQTEKQLEMVWNEENQIPKD